MERLLHIAENVSFLFIRQINGRNALDQNLSFLRLI